MLQTHEAVASLNSYFKDKFLKTRAQSMVICEPLEIEDFVVQPIVDVSPPKWHLAHTTWFFETFILVPNLKGYRVFNPDYAYLFNSYYITAGDRWTRAERGHLTRPTVKDIYNYRKYVDEHFLEFLSKEEITDGHLQYLIEIGLQHEQQHQELLLYDIKYVLGHNPLFPAYSEMVEHENREHKQRWISIDEGKHQIGFHGNGFSFDNEKGRHTVFLHAFEISSDPVTNGEYLEFMESGGYSRSTLWLSDGWDWTQKHQVNSPMYWVRNDDKWNHYTLGGLKTLDLNEPVSHVSFYEADAYARWAEKRLPTEFEWEVACQKEEPEIPASANFVENGYLAPISSDDTQFYGNLWEWTESAYRPYPYYKTDEGTIGEYNGKFMMNQMVLRGGSYATPREHIRSTYRNFFQPHLQWLFNGIRLAAHIQ